MQVQGKTRKRRWPKSGRSYLKISKEKSPIQKAKDTNERWSLVARRILNEDTLSQRQRTILASRKKDISIYIVPIKCYALLNELPNIHEY